MQIEQDMATCESYGLKPGSEAFGNCRLQLDLARQQPHYRSPYMYGGYGGHHYRSHIGTGLHF